MSARDWTDHRDGQTWRVTLARIGVGARGANEHPPQAIPFIEFQSSGVRVSTSTARDLYSLDKLTDADLADLLDVARREAWPT